MYWYRSFSVYIIVVGEEEIAEENPQYDTTYVKMYVCIYANTEEKVWLPGVWWYFLKASYSNEYDDDTGAPSGY